MLGGLPFFRAVVAHATRWGPSRPMKQQVPIQHHMQKRGKEGLETGNQNDPCALGDWLSCSAFHDSSLVPYLYALSCDVQSRRRRFKCPLHFSCFFCLPR